jgi:hypothetical protein
MADGDGFGVGGPSAKAARRSRPYVKFSAQLARAILRRAALGEPVLSICADDGMPSHNTVTVWARTHAAFGRALARAREAAAADDPGEAGFCQDTAREIFARLCEGEGLYRICADPRMPGKSTVYRWRERVPEFDRAVRLARDICAETVCEESLEAARAVTPETASATRVRLEHERWFVRAIAPHRFGPVRAVDPSELASGGEAEMTVIVRKFTDPPGVAEATPEERRRLGLD